MLSVSLSYLVAEVAVFKDVQVEWREEMTKEMKGKRGFIGNDRNWGLEAERKIIEKSKER